MAHKQCPHCGHPNVPDTAFCGECGHPLQPGPRCPGCGFTGNPSEAIYCVRCGASLRRRSFAPFILLGGLGLALLAAVILWQTGPLQQWAVGRATPSADRPPTPTTTSLPAPGLTVPVGETAAEMKTTSTTPPSIHTPTSSSMSTRSPTATPPSTATRPPTATPPSSTNTLTPTEGSLPGCPGAPPQRVRVGGRAWVCTAYDQLVARAQPGRSSSEITRLRPGMYVTVVDGPVCAEDWSWWKVQTDSGIAGWVSEGGDDVDPYFICPAR